MAGKQDKPEVRALVDKLAALLKESELSQNALARLAGYDKSTVSRFMAGQLSPPWNFVETLIKTVSSRREVTEDEVTELCSLWEDALFARDGRSAGFHTVRKTLGELRSTRNELRDNLKSAWDSYHSLFLGVLATLIVFLAIVIKGYADIEGGMTGFSGDTPAQDGQCVVVGLGHVPACAVTELGWRLPPSGGGPVETAFEIDTHGNTLTLGGSLVLETDCHATARWRITAVNEGGTASVELIAGVLKQGRDARLYAPIRRDTKTITLTAQRTDSTACAATLLWQDPHPPVKWPLPSPRDRGFPPASPRGS